jgi:glycosyltransferase involved in cell wall biosynthesis
MSWLAGRDYSLYSVPEVSSHNYELKHIDSAKRNFPKYKAVTAKSKILYDKIIGMNDNIFLTRGGVRDDLFYPSYKRSKIFTIGWVGRPTNGSLKGPKIDIKGYHTILLPIIEKLKNEKVKFKICDNIYNKVVPYEEMNIFYNNIDLYICTSYREGHPNPVFESAAAGKAIISTRVGCAAEMINHGNDGNGFIIDAYNTGDDIPKTIDKFVEYILYLKDNQELCKMMGERSRKIIEDNWTWEKRSKDWIPFFESSVNK